MSGRDTKYFASGEKGRAIQTSLKSINHEQMFGVIHWYERNEKSVTLNIQVFWVVTPCILVNSYQRRKVVPFYPGSSNPGRLDCLDNRHRDAENVLKM
jgi:hypothetical protein